MESGRSAQGSKTEWATRQLRSAGAVNPAQELTTRHKGNNNDFERYKVNGDYRVSKSGAARCQGHFAARAFLMSSGWSRAAALLRLSKLHLSLLLNVTCEIEEDW
ncbi:hypothetical protein NDU88_002753 [Pleurodeles waltl]|uniref:Uncharacterized protein n=1 Tax=Pleurodeles waltl TaxID=8319 RepID=A0AAV7PAL5_PLEWA|nr:hypothetical protein NDU88_002753 [Pleurodeles waltl]